MVGVVMCEVSEHLSWSASLCVSEASKMVGVVMCEVSEHLRWSSSSCVR